MKEPKTGPKPKRSLYRIFNDILYVLHIRCRQAEIPEDRGFATKPQLPQQMLARAVAAGVPATWVAGDSVYGDDRRLRMWLEAQRQTYVLAVSGKEYVWLGWRQRQVKTILAALPEDSWMRLSAGDGAKGPRCWPPT